MSKELISIGVVLFVSFQLLSCESDDDTGPTLQAPELEDASEQSFPTDAEITPVVFMNTGGGTLTNCSVMPDLPAGLSVSRNSGQTTCQITGTPTEGSVQTTYVVTATNSRGSNTGSVAITVTVSIADPDLADAGTHTFYVDHPVNFSFINSGGGSLTGCTFASTLPAGLSVGLSEDSNTCRISGDPTTATDEATFMVTATNPTSSDTATISLSVSEVSNCVDVQRPVAEGYPVDMLTVPTTLEGEEGNSRLYVRGNLSNWAPQEGFQLSYRGRDTENSVDVYQVVAVADTEEAADGYDPSATQFKIASDDGSWTNQFYVPIADNFTIEAAALAFGQELTLISADGGVNNNLLNLVEDNTYAFTMALNTSLTTLDRGSAATPNLVGTLHVQPCTPTPVAANPGAAFTVLGDGSGLAGDNVVTIATSAMGDFSDTVRTAGDSAKMTSAVDSTTGVVTVNVLAAAGAAQFTTAFTDDPAVVERRNFSYFAGGQIIFEMNAPAGYGDYGAEDGISVRIDHSITGGAQTCDCDIDLDTSEIADDAGFQTFMIDVDDLVEGGLDLALVTTGLVITPNATTQIAQTALQLQIQNARWVPAAPSIDDADDQSYIASIAITDLSFNSTGGAIQENGCTVTPALPAGLSLSVAGNSQACVITGTPTAMAAKDTHTITAANAAGMDTAMVAITVEAIQVRLDNIDDARALTTGLNIAPIQFTNSGGTSVSATGGCAVDPELPAGLTLGTYTQAAEVVGAEVTSCQITGAATAASDEVEYTVTGTDGTATDTATVTISVADIPADPQACIDFDGYLATAEGYPITVTGDSQRLYLRGNHSNWQPDARFIFQYKDNNIYQSAAVFDGSGAADNYVSSSTQFKVASDDGSWTTQLYVQAAGATNATDLDTDALPTDNTARMVGKSDGMGVDGNNQVDLTADANYLFTLTLTEADPADGVNVGTLTIQQCQ